ncbi:hypothetical protein [Pseudomonas ovata]|nr:hypothetical protein [Pseudomonas ovata]
MTEEKKSEQEQKQNREDIPAHSTPEEKERLKDFNKDGIPPGAC